MMPPLLVKELCHVQAGAALSPEAVQLVWAEEQELSFWRTRLQVCTLGHSDIDLLCFHILIGSDAAECSLGWGLWGPEKETFV